MAASTILGESEFTRLANRFGLNTTETEELRGIRKRFDELSRRGPFTLPDYTLHEVGHSDNVFVIVCKILHQVPSLTLNKVEKKVLSQAVYLHDFGMFISSTRFKNEILGDTKVLQFCSSRDCDDVHRYDLGTRPVAEEIRKVHHLLSAYELQKKQAYLNLDRYLLSYLMTVCRGHSKTRLTGSRHGCRCYWGLTFVSDDLRIPLLTGLLRLADACDFTYGRAPPNEFEDRAEDFLKDLEALRHWLKHYFAEGQRPTIAADKHGNNVLRCDITFAVPRTDLAGTSYRHFFRDLFSSHVEEANQTDLDISQYPTRFIREMQVDALLMTCNIEERPGRPEVPALIGDTIVESGTTNFADFQKWLQASKSSAAR